MTKKIARCGYKIRTARKTPQSGNALRRESGEGRDRMSTVGRWWEKVQHGGVTTSTGMA